jgi:hypothetical protein
MGSAEINNPDTTTGTFIEYRDWWTVSPTIIVWVLSIGRNMSASNSSFHIQRELTIIKVAIGGPDTGIIIFLNILKLPQPSIIEDSMISHGILRKKGTSRYTLKGAVIPV